MSRKLIVNDGRRERELLLVGKIVVGRDPMCDVSEADTLLSRRHAEFFVDGNTVVVRDLGSRNGIYVNGARLAQGRLRSGDLIGIGNLMVRYIEDAAPIAAAPELADVDATAVMLPASIANAPVAATPLPTPAPMRSGVAATPARPAPAPAAAGSAADADPDKTSYVPPSSARPAARSGSASKSAAGVPSRPSQPARPPAPESDDTDVTSLVKGPSRSAARFDVAAAGPDATLPVAPPLTATPPTTPPASVAAAPAADVDQTRVVAPPSFREPPKPAPVVDAPAAATAPGVDLLQHVRALSAAVEAIADFLARTCGDARAIDAVQALGQELAIANGRADGGRALVRAISAKQMSDELNRLVERLRAASSALL